jgi:phosphatidylinositol alpha-1,6-mannosyltransferase
MKLLFISRAYPPVVGGIENQNYELSVRLPKLADTTLLVNRQGKKFLPFFFPFVLVKTFFTAGRYDAVLLGDGVLALVGFFIKIFHPKVRVASVIHGLDVTYCLSLYQTLWVKLFLPSLDVLLAVSEETKNVAVQHGLTEEKIQVIPNGVDQEFLPEKFTRAKLDVFLGFETEDTIVLLTHGRLAKRKGVAWFIENVLTELPTNTHYVVSGSGPEQTILEELVSRLSLTHRVHLLGRVSDEDKLLLLHTADIFIQPNIKVPGDMEGFGIAVIEATSCGRPVVASKLEGLIDALAAGKNGILVEHGNPKAWVQALLPLIRSKEARTSLGNQARLYTEKNFTWDTITKRYLDALGNNTK